jgi:predicted dehydrogenase
MVYATADGRAGDRLRVGMVGGGRGAFIGAVHRFALRLDDQIALVAGALSSDAENAKASAAEIGIAPDRSYADYREMARAEATRPDGIEAVVIVTPNHLHAPISQAFMEAGIDVICDKPLAMNVAEAEALVAASKKLNRKLLVTLNNTGYPMVRQAREMVAAGELGPLRAIHASYIQDWLTQPIDADGNKQAEWRTDPARAGESAVLADIGVHAYNLASFISDAEAEQVSADLFTAVPGRRLDDNAHVLVHWTGGARGTVIASQTSPGHYNDLTVRASRGAPLLALRAGVCSDYPRRSRLDRRRTSGFAHAGGPSRRLHRGLRQLLPRRRRDHPRAPHRPAS